MITHTPLYAAAHKGGTMRKILSPREIAVLLGSQLDQKYDDKSSKRRKCAMSVNKDVAGDDALDPDTKTVAA